MSDRLKPCPFCGSEAKLNVLVGGQVVPHCKTSGCVGNQVHFETSEKAMAAWNRRAEAKSVLIAIKERETYCPNCGNHFAATRHMEEIIRYRPHCQFCGQRLSYRPEKCLEV